MEDAPVPKVKKAKPSSVSNANIARETRLKRIQERKDAELNKQLDARLDAREKSKKKTPTPVNTDESDSSDDEEVIVYEPVIKPKKTKTKSKPIDVPVKSQHTLDLEKQLEDMNNRFKQLEESYKPKRNVQDDMITACKHRILNF